MATITAKLALDASGFTAGLTRAQAALGRLKAVGVPAVAAGFAAASAAAVALSVGIKKAVDIGGQLSELSARTGIAAGELRVLGQAFDRAGIGADAMGPIINKMQRAIVEAGQGSKPAQDAIASLGLTLGELQGMSTQEQFMAIGRAISGLSNPAQQAASAMELFGRSGGSLLALFQDSGALNDAARSIGGQADILTRNAALFDRASDILGTAGKKLEGLFIGVADSLVPAILPLLEAFDGIDFANVGQQLGQSIGFGLTAITSGKIGDLLTAQFRIAVAEWQNGMLQAASGVVAFFVRGMQDIPKNFLSGVLPAMSAILKQVAAEAAARLADLADKVSNVPGLGGLANTATRLRDNAASLDVQSVMEMRDAMDVIGKSIASASEAATGAMSNFRGADTSALEATRAAIIDSIVGQQMATQAAARQQFSGTRPGLPDLEGFQSAAAGRNNTGIIAQTLQRVGGGAAFARFSDAANPAAQAVREQKKGNEFLREIRDRITDRFAPATPLMAS